MRRNVRLGGELIDRDNKRMETAINTLSMTYDLVDKERFKDVMLAESNIIRGRRPRLNR